MEWKTGIGLRNESWFHDKLVPIAHDLPPVAVAVLAIPNCKGHRRFLPQGELDVIGFGRVQLPNKDHAPSAVPPDAFAADVLSGQCLGLQRSESVRVGVLHGRGMRNTDRVTRVLSGAIARGKI